MTAVEETGYPYPPLLVIHPRERQSGLIVLLHGYTCSAWNLRDLGEYWAWSLPHVKIILPSSPTCLGKGGEFTATWFTHNQSTIDREILCLVEAERVHRGLPLSRVFFVGFSQGGSMASWLAWQLPYACGGLVLISSGGTAGLENITEAARKTPVLHCTGTEDDMVSVGHAKSCNQAMTSRGLSVTYWEYPGVGHDIGQKEQDDILGFLRTFLPRHSADPAEALACSLASEIRRLGGTPPTDFRIPDGVAGMIHGLKGKPELNGKTVRVSGFDNETRRIRVDLGQGKEVSVKMENFTQTLTVRLLGVRRTGVFSGCLASEAEIIGVDLGGTGVDSVVDTYVLRLAGTDREARLAPDQVLLPEGSVAQLLGLTADRWRHVCGRFCRVVAFKDGRYTVDVERETAQLSVRPRNLCP